MDPRLKILYFFVDLILPLFVGYMLVRRGRIKADFFDWMMLARIVTLAPMLAVLSFWAIELKMGLIWLPVLGVVMQVIPGVVALLRVRAKFRNSLDRGSYVLSNMLGNRGVVGLLAVFILYGERGFAYGYLVMLLGPVVLYFFCFPMAGYFRAVHRGEGAKRPSFKFLLWNRRQIPLLGILIGMGLNLTGVSRPAVLGDVFPLLLHISFWALVLPLGASMDFGEMKSYWRRVADVLPIKFIVAPALVYALALAVGLEGEPLYTVVILSCSPTAISAVFTSKLFKLNVHLAMAAFLLTMATHLVVVLPAILLLARGQ